MTRVSDFGFLFTEEFAVVGGENWWKYVDYGETPTFDWLAKWVSKLKATLLCKHEDRLSWRL